MSPVIKGLVVAVVQVGLVEMRAPAADRVQDLRVDLDSVDAEPVLGHGDCQREADVAHPHDANGIVLFHACVP